jgi:glycosyltransferase 2 family protein
MNPAPPVALSALPAPQRWVRPLALLTAAACALYLLALWFWGTAQTWAAAQQIGLTGLACGLLLSACGFVLRWARWRWLMQQLGHRLPARDELAVYLAGLAVTSTPGKLGETIRSALLLRHGVAVPHSLAAFVADRLSDVLGVAVLGLVAARLVGSPQAMLEALAVVVALGGFAAAEWLRRHTPTGPAGSQPAPAALPRAWRPRLLLSWALQPAWFWARVWRLPHWAGYAAVAAWAYGLQAVALWAFLLLGGAPLPLAQCLAMHSAAVLLGAASLVPSGLGVTEAALLWQLSQAGVPPALALPAVLLLRLTTLWFGIGIGVLALLRVGTAAGAPTGQQARPPQAGAAP